MHSTPWGEVQRPPSHLPGPEAATQRPPSRATTIHPGTAGGVITQVLKEEEASYQIAASGISSSASIADNTGCLVRPLTDKV